MNPRPTTRIPGLPPESPAYHPNPAYRANPAYDPNEVTWLVYLRYYVGLSGAGEGCKKVLRSGKVIGNTPQGLKPYSFYWLYRHD
jgi:hypothetical protein